MMFLPSINFLYLVVSEIQPGQDFKGQGHYNKVKPKSHHDTALLQPLTSNLMVLEIQPRQDFQTQGHYGMVKGQMKVPP